MPDSFGKRNRDVVKARKAAARDDRRIARNQRQRQGGAPDQPSLYRPLDQVPGEARGGTDSDSSA